MKMLKVGDLHLHTREMRSTKRLVDNNVVMLEGVYNLLVENVDIKLLTYMGDIQHATPSGENTLEEVSKWDYWFKKIGMLMAERFPEKDIKILETLEDGEEPSMERIKRGEIYPVFTLEGNHDVDNKVEYTYFDDGIKKGWFINPEGLIIEGTTQVNFFNYGDAEDKRKKRKGVTQVIGLYHDIIATEESPFWVGKHPAYPVERILDGVDLGIVGHIHTNSDPIIVHTESGGTSVSWTLGSMGRTAYSQGQIRDFGYCGLVDTDDLEQLGTIEIDLIPKEEYFNMRAELKSRETKRTYEDFRLGLDDTVMRQFTDPREDIKELDNIPEDVRLVCLEIMDEVMEG